VSEDRRVQAVISQDLLDRVLAIAGTQTILVGGQALAFWASYYRIDEPVAAISKDADFLGSRNDVDRFATGLNGVVRLPDRRMKTALLGRVEVAISDMEYVHIDVLLEVFGDISQKAIRERSYAATIGTKTFKVMHPLDVLQGRLENVYGIKEKQDEHGVEQLRLAIQVVRAAPARPWGFGDLKHLGLLRRSMGPQRQRERLRTEPRCGALSRDWVCS